MSVDYVSIGKQIKTERLRIGMTQLQLAERANISQTFMSNIETGEKKMSLDTFIRIADSLNISSDALLVDNLHNPTNLLESKFKTIMADCSIYEQKIIVDAITAIKDSLRRNKPLK